MQSKIIAMIFFLLIATLTFGQDFDKAKMDQLFSLLDKHEQSMGSISIWKDGKEVYTNAIGYTDLENKKPANPNTIYRVGSISKLFTACIIMKLVEDKKLKLTTPLTRFFPRLKNSSRITVEHMLRHTSGIYNFTNSDEYLGYMYKTLTRDQVYQKILEFGSSFEPGEDAEYSNSNFVLLSMIAEKVTKKSFDILVKEMIADPLNLSNTKYGSRISTANNEAYSYKRVKTWEKEKETDLSIPLGAGGVVSTASDLNKFLVALFDNKIISEDSRKRMMTMEKGFGLGMLKVPYNSKSAYGHNGGIDGFTSMAYHFPPENLTITYLSNGSVYTVNDVMISALGIYFGENRALPEFLPVMKLKSEELDKYLGTYASDKLPIELTITKDQNQLMGQASGQQSFPLDAYDVNQFKFDSAKLKIEFFPGENRLLLIQGGQEYNMMKK